MNHRIDLCGTWELYWTDYERGHPVNRLHSLDAPPAPGLAATVPGEVHLDLLRAGLIEEPATSLGCLRARWVEETAWIYRKVFQPPAVRPGDRVHLVFEELDLAATVYLNGVEVARHANVFCPLRIDITGKLKDGPNVLVVELDSGLYAVSERPSLGYGMNQSSRLHKRNWLRKTQSSFSWDWSQRLVNVGISGPVRIEVVSGVRVEGLVALPTVSPNLRQARVTGRLFVEGLDDRTRTGVLQMQVQGTDGLGRAEVEIRPGMQSLEVTVPVNTFDLWWPVGHGSQPLYRVSVTLSVEGQTVAEETRRVGFRHVRVNQDPHPQGGQFFIVEVNGKPVFCKGGNFVPADPILARIDRARYATLVDRALEANGNMLRVWGGGLYERDDFYDLCDEKGILVWQEFIFACAKYPSTDEAFLASIKSEATHQVRRLAHHPSLIIWCGNNELEWGSHEWGYEKGVAHPDYAIYHLVLPVILRREDGTRYYQPSSPYSPDQDRPNRDDRGDQHPWSVGFANTDFRDYRKMICRFPNEGGILGPTALPTVRACLEPGQNRVKSFAWQVHENSIACHGWSDRMLPQWLGKTIESMTLADYVYYGGVLQGEGLGEYIRNFRRRMFSSASAIFWMYNDAWPVVRSWTIVDYYQRRTPSFHPVRRAFAPVTVALAVEEDRVQAFGINEGPAIEATLRYGLFALACGFPIDRTAPVCLPANQAVLLGEFALDEWTKRGDKSHGAFAILSRAGRTIAQEKLFLPFARELEWPKPTVRVRHKDGQAIFDSDTFAWRVCLDLDGERPFPDNFFDLLPGVPYALDWPESLGTPAVLRFANL